MLVISQPMVFSKWRKIGFISLRLEAENDFFEREFNQKFPKILIFSINNK